MILRIWLLLPSPASIKKVELLPKPPLHITVHQFYSVIAGGYLFTIWIREAAGLIFTYEANVSVCTLEAADADWGQKSIKWLIRHKFPLLRISKAIDLWIECHLIMKKY